MPQSRNINTYGDIKVQLESCRAHGGARIDFETFGQATVWMARAYTYRSLLRKQVEQAHSDVLGYIASTPWDDMIIRHNKVDKETFVTVEFSVAPKGIISGFAPPPEAVPLAVASTEADDLVNSIAALAAAEGRKE